MSDARTEIMARLRTALDGAPEVAAHEGTYERERPADLELLIDRLRDYKANVHETTAEQLAATLAQALSDVESLAVPADLPEEWLSGYAGEVRVDPDVAVLDRTAAVLTGAAVAIAETGTIILDAGRAQGKRELTLVPDRHVCVVFAGQVVGGVPEGIARLERPTAPLTWISGPSATSDIELQRVEGVHGPRTLDVVVVRP